MINSDETVENNKGGRQSRLDYRFDLMDPIAMFRLAGILDEGSKKYGIDNWKKISKRDHINHALVHLYSYLGGLTTEDNLGHALCRIMFAIGVEDL